MRKIIPLLLLLMVVAGGVYWGVASAGSRWTTVAPGIEMRTVRAALSEGAAPITVFRAQPWRVQVVTGAVADAEGWRKRHRAVVAVNGGFFDENDHSLGLRIANRRRVSKLRDADWGVFLVRDGHASIIHTRDYQRGGNVTQAVQCGPRLVVNGRVTVLKNQYAPRTGIGVQRDGKIVIAVTDRPLSLVSWAKLWAASDGLNCRDALNLDGGGSTQMSLQTSRHNARISGNWKVPDAIIIK